MTRFRFVARWVACGTRFRVCGATGLLLLFFVSACFAPVPSYQRSDLESSAADLRRIAIVPISERRGQILRALLEERFATAEKDLKKTHSLSVSLTTNTGERDFGRTRIVGEMRVTARFVLREQRTREKQVVLRGSVIERSNYTVSSQFLARRDAEEEALRHVLALVADEMLLRLRLYFFTQASKDREQEKEEEDSSLP